MGKTAVSNPAAATGNPMEQFVQKVIQTFEEKKTNILRTIEEKRAEVDRASQEMFSKNSDSSDKNMKKKKKKHNNNGKQQRNKNQGTPQQSNAKKTKKKAADDREVKEYIAKSYRPVAAPATSSTQTPSSSFSSSSSSSSSASAKMPKKGPQKVTVADLDDADKAVVGASMNAITTVASAAAVIVACYAASRAMRKPDDDAGEKKPEAVAAAADSANLDSAYATPSKATLAEMKGKGEAPRGGERPAGAVRGDGTSGSGGGGKNGGAAGPSLPLKPALKRNIFSAAAKEVAAANANADGAAAGGGSGVSRLGATGADQFAAVIRAKTALTKATRRMKQSGELRVKLLSARFAKPEDVVVAAAEESAFQLRVQCDADSNTTARGESTFKPYDVEERTISFNQRMSFKLPPASGEGGKREGEIRMQLCDADGATLCKSGLSLRAVLRAAPVTKEFPLFGPDLNEKAHVRLAFEWVYDTPVFPSSSK